MTAEELVGGLEDLSRGEEAQWRLVALGPAAVEPLRRFLLGPPGLHPRPRMLAAEALGLIGGKDATAALIAVLGQGDLRALPLPLRLSEEAVRNRSARELARLGDPAAVEPLLEAFRRFQLAEAGAALARFREPRALPYLVDALEDAFNRQPVADAIAKFGADAVPLLVQSLGRRRVRDGFELRPSAERRAESARLLGELADSRAEAALATCLADEARLVRTHAALGLLGLRPRGRRGELVRPLVEGLGDADPGVAEACGEGLIGIGEAAVPAVVAALSAQADTADLRGMPPAPLCRAARVLAGVGDAGVAALTRLARDSRPLVRWLAVATLARADSPLAESALRAARHDRDRRVRRTARVLSRLSAPRSGACLSALCGTLRRRLGRLRGRMLDA